MRHAGLIALTLGLGLGLSACSGGGSAPPPPIANSAGGTATPSTATAVVPLSTAASTAALPAVGGISGTLSLPAIANAAGNAALTVAASTSAPPDAPSLQSTLRQTKGGTLTFIVFYTFTVNVTTTFPQLPGFTITLPSSISTAGQQFFYAVSNPAATNVALQFMTEGPAVVNGQQLTFAPSSDSLTLSAGTRYIFTFYATSGGPAQQSAFYVLNSASNGGAPSITVYDLAAAGNTSPTRTISGSATELATGGFGIAVDRSGAIYAGNGNAVLVFPPGGNGNVAPTRVVSGSLAFGNGTVRDLALDPAGNLYVLVAGSDPAVAVFPPGANGNVAPTRVITGSHTTLSIVSGLGVDAQGAVFAGTIQSGTNTPTIVEFPSGAGGDVSPVRTIGGNATGLTRSIIGIAVDAADDVYADQPFQILEFGLQQNGNVMPFATFNAVLPAVGITGVALDPNGRPFAVTQGVAPGQQGASPPTISTVASGQVTALVTGALTGLDFPTGLAIGPQ